MRRLERPKGWHEPSRFISRTRAMIGSAVIRTDTLGATECRERVGRAQGFWSGLKPRVQDCRPGGLGICQMEPEDAVRIARVVADEQGWPWQEPVEVIRRRSFVFFGAVSWEVRTNAECLGMNVSVEIDDATGRVLRKGFLPR